MAGEIRQPAGLISVLLDKCVEFGDRHDAAMDLEAYDGCDVEAALLEIALDHNEDGGLVESSAESLARVWNRRGKTSAAELVARMHPLARKVFS